MTPNRKQVELKTPELLVTVDDRLQNKWGEDRKPYS